MNSWVTYPSHPKVWVFYGSERERNFRKEPLEVLGRLSSVPLRQVLVLVLFAELLSLAKSVSRVASVQKKNSNAHHTMKSQQCAFHMTVIQLTKIQDRYRDPHLGTEH
jgi:hypothetical protein